MREFLTQIRQSLLFDRIDEEGLIKTLTCLNAQIICCEKGKVIFHQGDAPKYFGVVLSGGVQEIANDSNGKQSVLWHIGQGELFAEIYAGANVDVLPASFAAAQDSKIMVLEYARVITGCLNNGCLAHSYLVTNLMRSIALKNLMLNRKLTIVTQRTTREKLLAFLHEQERQAGTRRFAIPFDRQTLADYLGVERSAMSAELSRMKQAGLIDYKKNEFEMLQPADQQHKEVHHG